MTEPQAVVYVVDDDDEVRDAIADLIDSVGLPTRAFASAQAFLQAYEPPQSGCLVLDVRMPGMNGLELQQELMTRGAMIPIIFLTGHGDIPMAVEAMRRGAVDFMPKPFREQELLDRIRAALDEGAESFRAAASRQSVQKCLADLTPRETQVLELVVAGKANKVIAYELGVSERTVEVHRAHVMEKMRVKNLAELVRCMAKLEA